MPSTLLGLRRTAINTTRLVWRRVFTIAIQREVQAIVIANTDGPHPISQAEPNGGTGCGRNR